MGIDWNGIDFHVEGIKELKVFNFKKKRRGFFKRIFGRKEK